MADSAPGPDRIRAYVRGTLPPADFAVVDAWLASLSEIEAERLLAAAGVADGVGTAIADLTSGSTTGFVPDLPPGRLQPGAELGAGGMAVVNAAHDRVLDRTVAIKVLRPRRPEESLEQYHLREAAFRREAAITAGLEHPAIPPIHEVGRCDGLPAFAMRRLDGRTFAAIVATGALTLAERLEILLRVAEAVGFAHSRGVVHRDLSPNNILVAAFGVVHVLDWGLAVHVGTQDGVRAGTPAWMAPEQERGVPADPRLDVFSLGLLICFAVTGLMPDAATNRSAGDDRTIPRGIAALIRRCCADQPQERYADAGQVAAELARWAAEGITLAQEATAWELAWLRLRRSPRIRSAALVVLAVSVLGGGIWWWQGRAERMAAEARLAQITATTALDRVEVVAVALDEVRSIATRLPHLAAAQALEARLQAAHDLAAREAWLTTQRMRFADLLRRTRTHGPWAGSIQDWRRAMRDAGIPMDPERVEADARILRGHALRDAIIAALPFLWRAEREQGAEHHAGATAALLAAAGPTPGWQALGRLLGRTRFAAHDPVFCDCADAASTLAEAAPTATALALFAPEPRLTAAARAALVDRPGDFWPLIASARAQLAAGAVVEAERLALVASGAEPGSLLPALVLGYAALQRGDTVALAASVARGLAVDPANSECLALQAVALARSGRMAEAQALVDRFDAGHLRYHLEHRVGHPMERSVQAMQDAGLRIPEAKAQLGPLAPVCH